MFLSGDRDEKSFDEYYGEMPWCTLKYEDRNMKKSLSQMFEVDGIPTLVLLKGTLLIITSKKSKARCWAIEACISNLFINCSK